jgi:Holliday junction resolvase-like predicted endonuclease
LFNYNYQNTDTVPLKKSYIDFSKSDDLDKFIEALKKFFRRFPFSLNNMNEKHYHSILYTVLTSFGADISANQETALGKSDLILKMPKTVYVIELKYDRSVESALAQIDDRDYTAAVLDDKKRIVKLAIKFSEKDRNIVDYKAVEVKN